MQWFLTGERSLDYYRGIVLPEIEIDGVMRSVWLPARQLGRVAVAVQSRIVSSIDRRLVFIDEIDVLE